MKNPQTTKPPITPENALPRQDTIVRTGAKIHKKTFPTVKKNNKLLIIGSIVTLMFVLICVVIFGYQYYQTLNTVDTTELKTEELSDSTNAMEESVQWNYSTNFKIRSVNLKLLLSPSLLDILSNEKTIEYSCVNLANSTKSISIEELSIGLKDDQLVSGLQKIANYIFTTSLINSEGDSLTLIKSRYKIQLNDVCKISNNKYVVLFLTTQPINDKLSLISKTQAAGGWLGNSHMAIIDNGSTKIYERFPFNAKLITLPKEKDEDAVLRFGIYYDCKNLISSTDNHLIINCNNNMFSFDMQSELFKEIAICGSHIKDGSYITSRYTCFDMTGESYLDTE